MIRKNIILFLYIETNISRYHLDIDFYIKKEMDWICRVRHNLLSVDGINKKIFLTFEEFKLFIEELLE